MARATKGVYQTVTYRVEPDALPVVERAMADYADYLAAEIPGSFWWTGSLGDEPTAYVTIIGAVDQQTDDLIRTCEGTRRFVDVLYANTMEDPVFTTLQPVAATSQLV